MLHLRHLEDIQGDEIAFRTPLMGESHEKNIQNDFPTQFHFFFRNPCHDFPTESKG
jgi:hypothetical protein